MIAEDNHGAYEDNDSNYKAGDNANSSNQDFLRQKLCMYFVRQFYYASFAMRKFSDRLG
jgi:hypothetical protein